MNHIFRITILSGACLLSNASLAAGAAPKPGSASSPGMPVTTPNRSVYLNGVDISSARNQELRNVHVKITESGDLFISGPQYQVTEEETFMPLSSYTTKSAPPEHKAPQPIIDNANARSPRGMERVTNGGSTGQPSEKPTAPSAMTPPSAPAQPASSAAPRTGG